MHLHQVLTGAVNPGDCCYSVGSVNDIPFTAYGSGCDVVILASDFDCVQIIPGAQNGNIQVGCVECSHQLGRIAASYGNTVCIFEPLSTNPNKRHKQLNYQWQKTGQFFLDAITYNLAWDPQGNRILAATERLQLWAPPLTDALIEEEDGQLMEDKPHPVLNDWNCVWQCKTAASVHIAKWSPDGEYFATVGKDDCLLKVWYPTTGWRSAVVVQDPSDKKPPLVHFSFVYLAHPRSVTGMSWRKTSKFMPKGSVCNVLLTSCEDGVCRLWSETLLPEDSLLGGQISENTTSFSSSLPGLAGNKDKIQHALESIHHLKHLRRGRRRSSALVAHSELLPSQLGTQDAHTHRHIAHHANALCHFHISASINPNTDIPSVLADSAVFNPDDGTGGGGFVVHWLNNKDLSFTSSMDLFMLQLRKFSEQQLEQGTEDPLDPEGSPMKFDFDLDEMSDKASSEQGEEGEAGEQGSTKASSPGSSSSMPLPSMLLERKMETLTTEWNKSPDMLFTIHPADGSFLVWHVKYLDEFNQGIFRQVQVSFSSRIPVAFPTGDANSLSKNILMYACTLTENESAGSVEQGRMASRVSHSASASAGLGSPALASSPSPRPGISPAVMMVSKHVDGSLNQWAVTFAERSAFSNVLTVSHKFRYCGHRFHLNDQACHTVLPLLLTSSHHNALLTPPSAPGSLEGEQPPTFPIPKGLPSRKQLRNAATRTFHDPNAIYSELILWRVDHIGPLSCTGGVSELARINSLHTSAFSNVAWLPTLIPSSVLGTYCNSASACFVASDGKNLRLYQAVVDARKLLDELSDPETSKLVGEVFNIVSQQSTARPGCIIELDVITNQCGANTQLLHVFQEDFILGYKPHNEPEAYTSAFPCGEDFQPAPFSEKFFLVVIEKDLNRNSVLQMWHLHLKSVQACVDEPSPDFSSQSQLMVPNQAVNPDSSPETSPVRPLPRSASTANLQSASKLILSSKLVYSKRLDLPHGVEVTRATPSAGHLSSSSIYPVCLAPYLIVTTCSDSRVRFWRCAVEGDEGFSEDDRDNRAYRWEPWVLMNEEEDNNSAVGVSGRPVAVSCSYIGRLAVAFKKPRQGQLQGSGEDFSMHVSIYECESTGGSEWVLEQTLHLDDFTRPTSTLDPRVSVDSNLFVYSRSDLYMTRDHSSPNIKHYVHLDWLSKEDGSHILTVGVGSNILMYGRISGMVNEQTSSKEGVAVITLPLGGSIKQGIRSRWILLRSVDLLSSVDGTPSLPVSLSWVRDGILVVGMDCEMHVYAQWHQDKKPGEGDEGNLSCADIAGGQTASSSVFEGRARSKSVFEGNTAVDEALRAPAGLQEGGLFEAAHSLSPTLPQYHPTQLLELMDLGKVRRAKAILAHLVKCIAGEVAVVRDVEAGEGGARRHLSRTISVTGSTAKDTIVAGRDGGRDYTEINSIPPLPLYSLMLADLDTSYKGAEDAAKGAKGPEGDGVHKSKEDQYSDLFQVPTVTTDDFVNFATDKPEKKSRVINLSQYGPTYFGPEHAQVLSSHLMHSSLPGLTRLEQMFLVALADTVATTSAEVASSTDQKYTGAEALDECGLRYLLAMRLHTCLLTSLPPLYRMQLLHQGLSTCHFAWAFHSEAEEELLNMIPAMQRGDPQWSELRAVGVGWWIRNINTLRKMVEKLGKAAFQRHNDPLDAALFYLAMKKKAVLWGLFRSQHDEKMTQFFKNNFSEDRWRKAALKNAFSLLGKQRFEQSAAFFLLAGSLKDAIEVLMEKMEDLQLAMIVARLYEADFENSSTCQGLLYEKVLGCNRDGSGYHCSRLHPDPFLRSIAYWIMKDYTQALDTLLERIPKEDDENPDMMVKSCNPVVFSFYNYLRTHPLIIRRHFANPEGTATTVGLTAEKSSADEINLIERKLFFTTANAHFKVGCPVLALEVLSKIPKVTKKLTSSSLSKASSKANLNSSQPLENGTQGSVDWGFPSAPTQAWGGNDSAGGLDWSQPVVKVEDEGLNLEWGDDKDEDSDEDDGLTMKKPEAETKDGGSESSGSKLQRENSQGESEVDVIAEQLKFRACLKILMTELRTLATGFEVDGGKLRFQLYSWLEKEIAAMHTICNYKVEGKEEDSEVERWGERTASIDISDDILERTDAGAYERHQMERRRLQAKQQHSERRKAWLRKNQALLRVFLSYCSLHGAKGGGVTSVRMELLFLLQESQQETTVKQLQSPLPLPTTLPLLSACIAPTKTVIANPVLHLSNHIHDILHTITFMENPPHPELLNDQVNALHTLAASLSACVYQALCDSHSYSSQAEANQFTGMVYQGLLLSERKRLRTESIEEHITPNSAPAQWPGVSSLISLLTSAREEDQPRLNVLLCEAVVAVYLALLIHGLGTHSCNELFRLAAHPLNNRMWAAVFGGGAKVVIKPKRPEAPPVAPPQPAAEDSDRYRRRFNMRMLVPGRPVKETPATPPPVPTERPTYREKFIPPELSMWDYFVAKPFLPLSDSSALYDSDESGAEDDEDDDDAFLSDTQITEHLDPNSYSWALIRLVMVKLAHHNVKNFLPLTGLDFTDLPVTSPLCNAVLKTLENWEQFLLERMNKFDGPPPNYINTYPTDLSAGGGPAILRHKAMLEPDNTPFKTKNHQSFPARRLWHFLVKQEVLQESLIRYIFTKKRKQSEVEADLGYPGGKAKIIHKESDIIMAFAINKANSNEIVLASTHDVQEVDVSNLVSVQPFTWIGEDFDKESRSSDDIDHRSSQTNIAQASSVPFAPPQMPVSASMPWLGTGQTSMGASVIMKRNLNNVKRMTSHPIYQYYMTGAQDGSVRMFEWNRPQQLICFRQAGNARVTRLYFNSQGNKCGVADGEGFLSLWQVNQTSSNPKPYLSWQCHTKTCGDFAFITSSSLIATAGQSNDNRNVCLWDTLISPSNTMVHAFPCHENGATVLQYAPKQQLLITGGRKGFVCVFDIRQRQLLHTFQAHDSAIKALALDAFEDFFVTGSAEGNMKVWKLAGHGLMHSFSTEHAKQSIFRNIGAGVMQVETRPGNRIFTCGADGTLKMRVLPDRYNIPSSLVDVL
ncbi:dmX-like protein 2 isoform X3 [Xyrichtys novacula]|uniref:DmX-like protein 2 isoform X3 n=1 Tax=Xyrichtys novacula TaxID=13765 RepID=A0AAV1EKV8_XYRNO|nr:dmX-like protein 2 isoform X3 [Xyrichtys novacula]